MTNKLLWCMKKMTNLFQRQNKVVHDNVLADMTLSHALNFGVFNGSAAKACLSKFHQPYWTCCQDLIENHLNFPALFVICVNSILIDSDKFNSFGIYRWWIWTYQKLIRSQKSTMNKPEKGLEIFSFEAMWRRKMRRNFPKRGHFWFLIT